MFQSIYSLESDLDSLTERNWTEETKQERERWNLSEADVILEKKGREDFGELEDKGYWERYGRARNIEEFSYAKETH